MTIQDWATIAIAISAPIAAIATLLAPALAEIVKFRISQPKPTPDPNQPKNRNHKIGGVLKRHFKAFWFSYLMLFLDIFLLIRELRDPAPLMRYSVFAISVYTTVAVAIFLFIVLAAAFKVMAELLSFTSRSFGEYLRVSGAHLSLSLTLFSMIDELHLDTMSIVEKPIPRPASRDEAITVIKEIKELSVSHLAK